MQTPPTLQTGYSGYGKSLATSLVTGLAGCAVVVFGLALIVLVRQVVTEANTEVPESLTMVLEEAPRKKTKAPVAQGPERIITVPTGPALVRMEPTKVLQERPELIKLPEIEEPEPDLLVLEELDENPFEEEKEVVKPVEKPQVAKVDNPAKRQGPSKAEIEERERRRLASLARKITKEATVISRVTPKYPRSAIRKRLEGRVVVTVTVGPTGKVSGCRISKSSGHTVLDESALSAARRHRFQPAKNGLGQSVSVKKIMPFHFQLAG